MKTFVILLCVMFVTAMQAAPRSSANYSIAADTANAAGSRSTSAAYTNDDSMGDIVGIDYAQTSDVLARSGFSGQLYEAAGLRLSTDETRVFEGQTRQVIAMQVLHDDTLLVLAGGVAWSVVSGPVAGISASGLVTAGKVTQDTPATVQGSYAGFSGQLDLSVRDLEYDGISLGGSLFNVWEEAGVVNIPVQRSGGSSVGSVSVQISTSSATTTATPGADYTSITNQTVTFLDGETMKLVPITILPGNAVNEPNETFVVSLSNAALGGSISYPSAAVVRIADAGDTTKPTIAITSPTTTVNVVESASPSLFVGAKATDNKGVATIQYSMNGGPFLDPRSTSTFTLSISTDGKTGSLACGLTPSKPGPNTIAFKSIDTRGNESAVVTRTFNYIVKRPLVVNKVGTGTLTAPFPGSDATKQLGFPYTIKATPGTGQVFNGWTVSDATGTGITAAMQELPSLTFTHQEGLVLTANFIANPFTAGIIGKYSGMVWPSTAVPTSGTKASNETVGAFSATVTGTGDFSGTLRIDGLELAVKGIFDNLGVARFGPARARSVTLARTGKPGLEVALNLSMSGMSTGLTGTVSQQGRSGIVAQSDITCSRAFYNSTNKVPVALAGTQGRTWTMLLRHETAWPGLTSADYPQGDGYASGTVKVDGTVSFAGKLADHTPFTTSALLSEANAATLYTPLYGGRGFFLNQVMLTATTATDGELASATNLWLRPYQNVQWYPWGWPEGLGVQVFGASYQVPTQVLWSGLNATNPVYGNVAVTFKAGLLNANVNKTANFFAATAAKVPTTDTTWSFTLTPSTGVMTGTFPHSNGTKPTWQGVLIQRGGYQGGWGYFMSTAPKVIDGTGESGRVEMSSK